MSFHYYFLPQFDDQGQDMYVPNDFDVKVQKTRDTQAPHFGKVQCFTREQREEDTHLVLAKTSMWKPN